MTWGGPAVTGLQSEHKLRNADFQGRAVLNDDKLLGVAAGDSGWTGTRDEGPRRWVLAWLLLFRWWPSLVGSWHPCPQPLHWSRSGSFWEINEHMLRQL